ncbi:MAG: hypothetical protein J0I06_18890 [Planctomycetes bacterium]|nr:hypothetical protein [Planctomycetota bacterium]
MSVRFSPDACLGCGEPLRPKYSTYRHGTRGPLFTLGLVGGMFAVLGLLAVSFLGGFALADELFANANLPDREKGALTFLIQIPMFALVVVAARLGFRALHRLPRTFTVGCETCTWTGPCKVYEAEV